MNDVTPIQELIQEIDSIIKGINSYGDKYSEYNKGAIANLSSIKIIAKSFLKKEKERDKAIASAAWDACQNYEKEREDYRYGKRGGFTEPHIKQLK